jgi:hypothetical protein
MKSDLWELFYHKRNSDILWEKEVLYGDQPCKNGVNNLDDGGKDIPETLSVCTPVLTWLKFGEDFIVFSCREIFEPYILKEREISNVTMRKYQTNVKYIRKWETSPYQNNR